MPSQTCASLPSPVQVNLMLYPSLLKPIIKIIEGGDLVTQARRLAITIVYKPRLTRITLE